jgi:hypothetical protein
MKRFFFVLLILTISVANSSKLYAQEKYKVYCSIIGNESELRNGIVSISIDYGQDDLKKNYLVDEQGNRLKFRTMISAMNYMSKLGWNLEETSHSTDKLLGGLISVWILSKDVSSDSEITQGFQTMLMFEQRGK